MGKGDYSISSRVNLFFFHKGIILGKMAPRKSGRCWRKKKSEKCLGEKVGKMLARKSRENVGTYSFGTQDQSKVSVADATNTMKNHPIASY